MVVVGPRARATLLRRKWFGELPTQPGVMMSATANANANQYQYYQTIYQ